jgi:transcriptional regulator with XRE-family HTH domain
MSPYRLARLTGLSKQGVLNLEAEDADPKLSTIVKLAEALKLSPHDLLPPRSGEGVNVRDAASLARHLLPTARDLEQEARKERAAVSTFAVCDLAGRIRRALEAVEEAAGLARAAIPELKALIKEARRKRVMVSPPELAAHAEAVAKLLQEAAAEESTTVDRPPARGG